ncbi:hypothetical protein P692DRAFT_2062657 [Suillus brevipes Sb2]|nr:hypothetical protein P692DRAFT_2062657 [Suillus brevipes Sb2]
MFNTATWQLNRDSYHAPHRNHTVHAISVSRNDRLFVSTASDGTARLWNLATNLQVGPPLRHKNDVKCAAFSADGKLLFTACDDENAYVWDIQAILKEEEEGLKALLPIPDASDPESSQDIEDESILEVDATRGFGYADELPPGFFDNTQANFHSSAIPSARVKLSAPFGRFHTLLHRFKPNQVIKTQQPPVPSEPRLHALLHRLSSLLRPSQNTGTDEIPESPQPSMFAGLNPQVLLGRLSSLLPRPQLYTDEETEFQRSHTPLESPPGAFIGYLSSLFRSPPNANEAIELQHSPEPTTFPHRSSHVVNVSAMRDREVRISCLYCNCWVR